MRLSSGTVILALAPKINMTLQRERTSEESKGSKLGCEERLMQLEAYDRIISLE